MLVRATGQDSLGMRDLADRASATTRNVKPLKENSDVLVSTPVAYIELLEERPGVF
jgi:hypothetical protein